MFFIGLSGLYASDTTNRSKGGKDVLRNSLLLCANYGRQVPFGVLSNRFGGSNSVGFTVAYKFGNNYQIQSGINTIFSSTVKENYMFDTMIGGSNYLIDVNGNYAEIRMYQRGIHWHVDFGKIFQLGKFEKNSGLLVTGGLGFMQHYIKFNFQRTVLPQLEGEYAKGYDRLTNGLMARGFIGYQRIDQKAMLNFVGGLEILNGFTKNRRSFNYDTRTADGLSRNDLLIGLKIGVMISISGRKTGTTKGEEERYFD